MPLRGVEDGKSGSVSRKPNWVGSVDEPAVAAGAVGVQLPSVWSPSPSKQINYSNETKSFPFVYRISSQVLCDILFITSDLVFSTVFVVCCW